MYTKEEHLDNLVRHIELVREACLLLGKRLIASGRDDFGRLLIAKGFVHDASKFYGIEWDYLHAGPDVNAENLSLAIKQHQMTNEHHPEYWGRIENMPEIAIAEMVCDWYARSQEFGACLGDWIRQTAVSRFAINKTSEHWSSIEYFVDVLLQNSFVKAKP